MKYEVKRFHWDNSTETMELPDEYEPIGYEGGYVYAKKLVVYQQGYQEDDYTVFNESPFHPDDYTLDYIHPDDITPESLLEPLTINPVDKILLENLIKEYAWEDEQQVAMEQGGVFRHCEECNNIETIYPLRDSYMFDSSLDFCTRCEKPWGMGMEKDAWAEGQMMPGMREGIKIEAPDPISYVCSYCGYTSEQFAKTGEECTNLSAVFESLHDWMLEESDDGIEVMVQELYGDDESVYKPCIFCGDGFEYHDVNTHGYEPRERCKWCTLDEHMHTDFMHEYEILTEPGPNKGYCIFCASFNDKHVNWCKAIPKRAKAQRVCPIDLHDDISMHLCQCVEPETFINPNTGYGVNTRPAERQKTDYQADGGRDANAKAYAEQYGTGTRSQVVAEILASEAQRGDSPKVRCLSCQQDQLECACE